MAIKASGGRPAFVADDAQRKLVKSLAGLGLTHDDIGSVVGIGGDVLRREFRDELDRGVIEANTRVAESLFKMAVSGTQPAATFFWLKCRARWREVTHVEHSGEISLKNVSDADLEREISALRARASIAGGTGDVASEVQDKPNGILH